MHFRWSHEGVSLQAPVRNRSARLWAARGVMLAVGLVTVGFFGALREPVRGPDAAICEDRSQRSLPVCEAIRPSFETWRYADAEDYARARACSLAVRRDDLDLVAYTRATAGVGYAHNLRFLRMAAHQEGECDPDTVFEGSGDTFRDQALQEWAALTAIEQHYWTIRIRRAQRGASEAFARATWVRGLLLRTPWVWMPLGMLGWITALVGARRLRRSASPLRLEVSTGGVRLDDQRIPRSDIAFLGLEGQRLRVERWENPPVYSRPLPAEALAHADEICAALGVLGDDDDPEEAPAPPALQRLLRKTGVPDR